jgi:alkanesulfonate monooxygenase SsuD/methylene tetrahydromethanopterin reductase-like flavin-dependent oxidoreductase (luciferase family)
MRNWAVRYDLRAPAIGPPAADLYAAALEQCAWADANGARQVILSEHHGVDDGYLPAPAVFGAAVAARTERIRIRISAVVLTLRDPIQVAEDVIVLDQISNGRVEVVLAAGYVADEFAMFGVEFADRTEVFEEKVEVFAQAVTGEVFDYRGAAIRVTPPPVQRPRPPVILGGATPRSARRAALMGDGYMPAIADSALYDLYLSERERLGKDRGDLTTPDGPLFVYVAEDPDRAWAAIAPHALHEMNAYGRWSALAPGASPYVPIDDPDVLRGHGMYAVVTPDECVELARTLTPDANLLLHPLMGGMAPELGWEGLELFAAKVLPQLSSD